MNRTSRSRSCAHFVAMAALVSLVGCGDDSIAASDFTTELAGAVCDRLDRCPLGYPAFSGPTLQRTSPEICARAVRPYLAEFERFDALVDAGTVRFDGRAAADCVAAFRATCLPVDQLDVLPECRRMVRGRVPESGACVVSDECVDGTHCERPPGPLPATCSGTCRPLKSVGATCTTDVECPSPEDGGISACEPNTDETELTCVVRRYARVSVGEPCGRVDTEGPMRAFAVCNPGLFCRRARSFDDRGVCSEALPEHTACAPATDVCVAGTRCVGVEDDTRCEAHVVRNDVGESCSDAVGGAVCNGFLRLRCVDGQCEEVGDGTAGSRCGRFSHVDCDEGLYCDTPANSSEDGTCAPKLADGVACDQDFLGDVSCTSGFCDASASPATCAPVPLCRWEIETE